MYRSRILIAADSEDFDKTILNHWAEEGFSVAYLYNNGNRRELAARLAELHDQLGGLERYAIIAFGEAATAALDIASTPRSRLEALVAYYPIKLPPASASFPPGLQIISHLARDQEAHPKFKCYLYPEANIGFAESDLEDFDKIAAGLAWSRTLAHLRKAFHISVDLESIWEEHLALEFAEKDVDATMGTMVAEPYVNHVPTMTGGIGYKELHRFYKDFFIPNNPPSMKVRLLSRTIGVDRVVDEMHFKFTHTQEIPWMLPGLKPTNKEVEVILVSVVCIRGGKLYHEHIHWDQATVLMQIGLLDPQLVPKGFGKKLPIVGAEGARKCIDEQGEKSNKLLPSW